MDQFREDIKKMVQIGNDEKGKRMSRDQMQDRLRVLYRSRFHIPSSHHIGQCINSNREALKKADEREGVTEQTSERYYIPAVYSTALEDLLSANRQLMPGEA